MLMLKQTIVLAKAGNPWARLLSSHLVKRRPAAWPQQQVMDQLGDFLDSDELLWCWFDPQRLSAKSQGAWGQAA